MDRAVRRGGPDDMERMLANAEAQLALIQSEFPAWMASELAELEKAWDAYKAGDGEAPTRFYRKTHDIRGQAATFGYPLAGRAADLLCKLIDRVGTVPPAIIEAHVQAIRAIVRDNVKTDDHPVGKPMIGALEKLSAKLVSQAGPEA